MDGWMDGWMDELRWRVCLNIICMSCVVVFHVMI
jgi:hypothetical protein